MREKRRLRFPLFLSLEGREILIIGAGRIAARRARVLLPFGGRIRICALQREEELPKEMRRWILERQIRYESRRFSQELISGKEFLVFAATNDPEVNGEIARICQRKGILVNNASDAAQCDFFFPSIICEEEMVIGIAGDASNHKKVKELRKRIQNLVKGERRPK